jgi:hypothetical protein
MKRAMPEFLAIPVVIVLLGVLIVILLAADAGLATWLIVGGIAGVAVVIFVLVAMRRPRAPAVSEGSAVFEGGAPPADDGVHRVLLVVDDACTTGDLQSLAGARGQNGTSVFVVAPAVSSRVARLTGDEEAYAHAQRHVDATVRALRELGYEASGHVGSHDPVQATDESLREFPADEIVFVLRGGDEAQWLEQDVVDIGRRRYSVPVSELNPAARDDSPIERSDQE